MTDVMLWSLYPCSRESADLLVKTAICVAVENNTQFTQARYSHTLQMLRPVN